MSFTSKIAGILFSCVIFSLSAENNVDLSAIATDAYIYGYPLVMMDMTKRVMTNVEEPSGLKAPVGQFANAKSYPGPSFRKVHAPNEDTLYSVAWLDLAKEPYVLHVPDIEDRYYFMSLFDGWTDVFASLGPRTTGSNAQDFVITGPSWQGVLPDGLKELKSKTDLVWIIGRIYSSHTNEDLEAVSKIQDQLSLTPLSSLGQPYKPTKGKINSAINMSEPVRKQVNHMDGGAFFEMLSKLLKDNPPTNLDASMVESLSQIGIIVGQEFDINKVQPEILEALIKAPQAALSKMADRAKTIKTKANGWSYLQGTGDYGTNYLERAVIAALGLGANLPQDVVYPFTGVDGQDKPLNGKNSYVLHFDPIDLPPVNGFWSLTMYDDHFFLTENPLNRYSRGSKDDLQYNKDGSLDIYIQNQKPEGDKISNWLPSPKGHFNLMLRLYWPDDSVVSGTWHPPAVELVSSPSKNP